MALLAVVAGAVCGAIVGALVLAGLDTQLHHAHKTPAAAFAGAVAGALVAWLAT